MRTIQRLLFCLATDCEQEICEEVMTSLVDQCLQCDHIRCTLCTEQVVWTAALKALHCMEKWVSLFVIWRWGVSSLSGAEIDFSYRPRESIMVLWLYWFRNDSLIGLAGLVQLPTLALPRDVCPFLQSSLCNPGILVSHHDVSFQTTWFDIYFMFSQMNFGKLQLLLDFWIVTRRARSGPMISEVLVLEKGLWIYLDPLSSKPAFLPAWNKSSFSTNLS